MTKTAAVRDLRNEFSRISKWLDKGEVVQVLRRGKPFAKLVPETKPRTFVGACPSPVPLPADLDEPTGADWDAAK